MNEAMTQAEETNHQLVMELTQTPVNVQADMLLNMTGTVLVDLLQTSPFAEHFDLTRLMQTRSHEAASEALETSIMEGDSDEDQSRSVSERYIETTEREVLQIIETRIAEGIANTTPVTEEGTIIVTWEEFKSAVNADRPVSIFEV
jgi:hypothetical protein